MTRRRSAAGLLGLGLLCATLATAGPARAEDRALLVGSSAAGVQGPADAARFARALTGAGLFRPDAVTLLSGAGATRDRVLAALQQDLPRQTGPGDRVVIYYSGPGGQAVSTDPREADGLSEVLILGETRGDILLDHELEAAIDALTGRRVQVFLDTGFAATAPGGGPRPAGFRGVGRLGELQLPSGEDLIGVVLDQATSAAGLAAPFPVEPAAIAPSVSDPGPLVTDNPGAEIWSAATSGSMALEDDSGGAFTSGVITAIDALAAQGGGEGRLFSDADLLDQTKKSIAEICQTTPICQGAGAQTAVSRVVSEDRYALLSDGFAGEDSPLAAPKVMVDAATEITGMSFDERRDFVTARFGSINTVDLALQVFPDPELRVGDSVSFQLSSRQDGNFILIDIDPLGRVVQVYPSSLSPATATEVRGGTPLRIPSAFSRNGMPLRVRVTPPAGQGLLMAIFVEGDLSQLHALLPEDIAGAPVEDGFSFLYQLADGLLGMYGTSGFAQNIWSTQVVEYRISP